MYIIRCRTVDRTEWRVEFSCVTKELLKILLFENRLSGILLIFRSNEKPQSCSLTNSFYDNRQRGGCRRRTDTNILPFHLLFHAFLSSLRARRPNFILRGSEPRVSTFRYIQGFNVGPKKRFPCLSRTPWGCETYGKLISTAFCGWNLVIFCRDLPRISIPLSTYLQHKHQSIRSPTRLNLVFFFRGKVRQSRTCIRESVYRTANIFASVYYLP